MSGADLARALEGELAELEPIASCSSMAIAGPTYPTSGPEGGRRRGRSLASALETPPPG